MERLDRDDRRLHSLRWDRAEPRDWLDSTERRLIDEPAENSEANDPRLPIDRTEPTLPMDRTDPTLPIDRIDPVEPIDRIERSDRMDLIDVATWAAYVGATPRPG